MDANFYRMFPEQKFAVVKLQSEKLSAQEARQLNYEYKADKNYSNIHYLLIIVDEKCNPDFSVKELEKLSDLYNNEFQINNHKKVVWLVAEPLVTAMAHIFVSYTNEMYCSTIAKAYELLDMPVTHEEFINLIQ
ncbi:MAG: hypothetical protein JXR41_00970 [Bacteroidales bacterium]|nr:hypothetical protein [Bacteroidales bacterium]MBN2761631.1 hypothetical protein [Bacteroidales bacterium]